MLRRGAIRLGQRQIRSSHQLSSNAIAASNLLLRQRTSIVAPKLFRAWFSSYPSHEVVGLPALSPTMETGTIANWNKEEGDSFGPGDVICSVETDKATVDFEAQDDGVVAKILVEAGSDELEVGVPIMITVEEEEDAYAFKDYVLESEPVAASPAPEAPAPASVSPTLQSSPAAPISSSPQAALSNTGNRVVASPLAHVISKEMGHDISAITGTGPGGRIIAADVREFVPAFAAELPTSAPVSEVVAVSSPISADGVTDFPISNSAMEVASRLAQSKRNVPHYYLTIDICMDAALKLRNSISATLDDEEEGIGIYELIIKAAAKSMKTVPAVNASWMDNAVRVYDSVDMNVVVGAGDKMYTPVIRDCEAKGLKAISDELNTAMSAVEEGEFTSEFASTGTFTIMNLGMYGIKSCAPIIREPQSCALALGVLENRIVPNDDPDSGEIYKESVVMTATISLDHRVVDGAAGAPWLSAFKAHLESPAMLLL